MVGRDPRPAGVLRADAGEVHGHHQIHGGIESEVAVLRGLGEGDERVSRVQIDGLGADDDDRVPVLAERFEGVKQG